MNFVIKTKIALQKSVQKVSTVQVLYSASVVLEQKTDFYKAKGASLSDGS